MLYRNMMLKYMSPVEGDGPADGEGAPASGGEASEPTTAELQATIAQLTESKGKMKAHMDGLLGEKKAEQERRKQAEAEAQAKALEASKKSNDLEAFEKTITDQFGVKETGFKTEIDRLNGMILGGKKNEIIADLAGDFISPEVAKLMLGNLISTEHGDNNTISKSFKGLNGELVTTDQKAFKEYLSNHEAFAPYMKGVDSSGGLNSTSKPAAGGGKSKEMKRSDFERTGSAQQMEFIKSGGKVI